MNGLSLRAATTCTVLSIVHTPVDTQKDLDTPVAPRHPCSYNQPIVSRTKLINDRHANDTMLASIVADGVLGIRSDYFAEVQSIGDLL